MKTSTLLFSSILALSLSACGATTGGLAKSMAKQAAVSSVSAKASPEVISAAPEIDTIMNCAALTTEMAEVDALIEANSQTIAGSGSSELAGQVAATAASQTAIRSGATKALAKVPFGGLFAKSAADSVSKSSRKKIKRARADLEAANLRKASLAGLYAGKNCAA